ncbi:MAG TPA: hypothetical protein VMF59_08165 [Bacteroidota bacterium]|nr:hypothetical protein [Bacteroidota bacterium]
MRRRFAYRIIGLVLAANYFAFQVELFDDEYEANHPRVSEKCSFTGPVFTWESFDKENAPEAFVVDPCIEIRPLFIVFTDDRLSLPPALFRNRILDKSPPSAQVRHTA